MYHKSTTFLTLYTSIAMEQYIFTLPVSVLQITRDGLKPLPLASLGRGTIGTQFAYFLSVSGDQSKYKIHLADHPYPLFSFGLGFSIGP